MNFFETFFSIFEKKIFKITLILVTSAVIEIELFNEDNMQ